MIQAPVIGFNATTTLKRSDYGLGIAVPMVSDKIKVRITTEAEGNAPAAANTQ